MPPEHEALLILTCQKFPALQGLPCDFEAILKGGSDRHFYRMTWPTSDHPPMVLMVYTLARRDNPKFVPATHRLAALGVRVPEIYHFDASRLCVWLQDLGRDDLHSHRDHPWSELRPLYEDTLREAAKIHSVSAASLTASDLEELEPPFDETLYLWEQDYFLDHFVRTHLRREFPDDQSAPVERCLRDLRRQLAGLPRCLVHRDFQSQNILLRNGQAWLVDYQGLRPGLAEYDLASLLFDPYVNLSRSQREELLQFYATLRGLPFNKLRETFLLCAAQRLMQALGAYVNLSRNQGKPHFLQHLPTAIERLQGVCHESSLLRPLVTILKAQEL
jgi:aminoglycoside/choline kinase family phosphotransferase